MSASRALGAIATAIALLVLVPASALAGRHPGIDVSRFQGTITWPRVAAEGIEFAFVQASRGDGGDCAVRPERCGPDEYYDGNLKAAKRAGIKVGPYHRAFVGGDGRREVRRDAQLEAAVFLESVGRLKGGDLRPALDVETPFSDLDAAELQLWVRVWLRRVEAKLGMRPIIYTNNTSWQALANTTAFADAGHRLWVANWNVRAPIVPANNWGGRGWKIWQRSSTGSVDGINGDVDLNVMRGGYRSVKVRR